MTHGWNQQERESLAEIDILEIVEEQGMVLIRDLARVVARRQVDAVALRRILNGLAKAKLIKIGESHVWLPELVGPTGNIASYRDIEVRAIVWGKTDGRCWYCGNLTNPFRDFHVDHTVPRSRGGTDDLSNLVPSCAACNLAKAARTLEEFRIDRGIDRFWGESS